MMGWQKVLVLFLTTVISSCFSNPVDHRFNLIADGDGKVHLIDIRPVFEEIETHFTAENDMRFLLYTRLNPSQPQEITATRESIANSNYNPRHQKRVLIHGYNSNPNSAFITSSVAAYLQRDQYNVIVVDWSVGANTLLYSTARNRIQSVADVLTNFINFLIEIDFTHPREMIFAGHSLGAHIAGLTGKRFTQERIFAIFGLDPAGPLFSIGNPNERLAANDAMYTEGIRTNAGDNGFDEPLCQADFYPNWGAVQPGCGVDISGNCAHNRATQFFAESINSNRFVGVRCANYAQLVERKCPGSVIGRMGGDPWSFGLEGVFFLETNANSPFARG